MYIPRESTALHLGCDRELVAGVLEQREEVGASAA
jgi:hypothetical protein